MWKSGKYVKREPDNGLPPAGDPSPVTVPPVVVPPVVPPPAVVAPAPTNINYKTPATQQLANMVTEAGMNPTEVLAAVTANGGSITPDIYAKLAEKHGEGLASILAGNMSTLHKDATAASVKADEAIYSQVKEAFKGVSDQSGADTLKELQGWAKENIDEAQLAEVNKLIKQGGMAAQLAVQDLVDTYKASGDFEQVPVLMTGDGGGQQFDQSATLTRLEYNKQVKALVDKGHHHDSSPEIKALGAQRLKSKARGIK